MSNAEIETLSAECRMFAAYLINQVPSPYIIEKYRDAHAAGNIFYRAERNTLDNVLLRLAMSNRLFLKLVDLYTSLFFKRALVRKKLVLLLAILESASPTNSYFDMHDPLGKVRFSMMAVHRGIVVALALLLSLVSILPLHLGLRNSGRQAPRL